MGPLQPNARHRVSELNVPGLLGHQTVQRVNTSSVEEVITWGCKWHCYINCRDHPRAWSRGATPRTWEGEVPCTGGFLGGEAGSTEGVLTSLGPTPGGPQGECGAGELAHELRANVPHVGAKPACGLRSPACPPGRLLAPPTPRSSLLPPTSGPEGPSSLDLCSPLAYWMPAGNRSRQSCLQTPSASAEGQCGLVMTTGSLEFQNPSSAP